MSRLKESDNGVCIIPSRELILGWTGYRKQELRFLLRLEEVGKPQNGSMTETRRVEQMIYSSSKVGEGGYQGAEPCHSVRSHPDGQRRGQLRGGDRKSAPWAALVGLALLGCAGNAAPAESPADDDAAYQESTPPEEAESVDQGQGTEGASTDAQSAAAEPASAEDLKQALQVVIQDESLLSELKLGEPGRFPLKIAGQSLSGGLELKAHSEAVEVVSAPEDAKTVPVLIFTNIDLTNKQGTFKYRYDIEGVRGTSYVEKNDQGLWELKSSRFSEY